MWKFVVDTKKQIFPNFFGLNEPYLYAILYLGNQRKKKKIKYVLFFCVSKM